MIHRIFRLFFYIIILPPLLFAGLSLITTMFLGGNVSIFLTLFLGTFAFLIIRGIRKGRSKRSGRKEDPLYHRDPEPDYSIYDLPQTSSNVPNNVYGEGH